MKNNFRLLILMGLSGLFISCLSYLLPKRIEPPMYYAVYKRDLLKVKQSIAIGVDVNERYGETAPLELAARNGDIEIVDYLLRHNAKYTENTFKQALRKRHFNIVTYLIDGGWVDIQIDPLLLLDFLVDYQSIIDFFKIDLTAKIGKAGSSIFHIAVSQRNRDLVDYLLENNFDINTLDDYNHTALFYLAIDPRINMNWENPVIENETIAKLNYTDENGRSHPLVFLSDRYFWDRLLDTGINVNQQNKAGWTVLHFIAASNNSWFQAFSLERFATEINTDLKTNYGRTAEEVAALRE
jgi:ankyrin repeat protein